MFGRGGEESQNLGQSGRALSASCPALPRVLAVLRTAGIPATHRDTNHAVIFLTGHDATGKMPANVNWAAIATAAPVIVMYMGVKNLGEIAQDFDEAGRKADDPVAIVSNASLPHQQVAITSLVDAGRFVAEKNPPTPAIVVVGHASDWRSLLDWYGPALRENKIG